MEYALHRLQLQSLRALRPELPVWVEAVLRKALHPLPERRQQALSQLVHDLHTPGAEFRSSRVPPLAERHPLALWRALALGFAASSVLLLGLRACGR